MADAFDDGMGIVLDDETILAGAGLALIAIAENVLRFRRLLGHERPLHAGRKACAATPAQVRGLNFINDVVAGHLQRLLQRLVAIEFQVAVDVRSAFTKALGDNLYLIGM